jgi:AcrR family transcriptional regulator
MKTETGRTRAVRQPARTHEPGDPVRGVGERIVNTASDLFYREGVRAVGIQRVIEEAGIAKASLYAHYESKDELIAACLAKRADSCRAQLLQRLSLAGLDPRAKLSALFDYQVEWVGSPGFRGCPFQNAGSEIADPQHPAKAIIAAQRRWLRDLMTTLAKEAGAAAPVELAGALIVLYDGAMAASLVDGNTTPARDARRAAEQILDIHLPARRRTANRRRARSR